jgi:hypothetical protein
MYDLRPYQRLFAEYPNLQPTLSTVFLALERKENNWLEAITTLVEALEAETKARLQAEKYLRETEQALKFI